VCCAVLIVSAVPARTRAQMEVTKYFATQAKSAPALQNLSLFGQQAQKVRPLHPQI
jgi:hypothetical protein